TSKGRGIAPIGPAQAVAAGAADGEKSVHPPLGVTHHEDGGFAPIGGEEDAPLGGLAFLAQEQATAGEDLRLPLVVDFALDEHALADQSAVGINEATDVCHHKTLLLPYRFHCPAPVVRQFFTSAQLLAAMSWAQRR